MDLLIVTFGLVSKLKNVYEIAHPRSGGNGEHQETNDI